MVSVRFWLARCLNESLVNGSVAELSLGVDFFRTQRTNIAGSIIANAGIAKAETCRIHNTTYWLIVNTSFRSMPCAATSLVLWAWVLLWTYRSEESSQQNKLPMYLELRIAVCVEFSC